MNFATIGQNIVKLTIKYWDKFLITGLEYTLSLAAITVIVGAIFGALIPLVCKLIGTIPAWVTIVLSVFGTVLIARVFFNAEKKQA